VNAAENVPGFVRAPKQERSRASLDRALDAAVALLVERRSAAFTLADVAERAGVSIGAIYGRVEGRDDLLRAAHAREMSRISAAQREAFAPAAPAGEGLADAVRRVVGTTGSLLRAEAPVMAPFMLLANTDAVIAEAGRATHAGLVDAVRAALLAHHAEIGQPDPERAVTWSCTVVYSVLARWLGLGSDVASAGEGRWEDILADLAAMITAFLASPAPPPVVTGTPLKSRESEG
jgi:AcrR family transcriptional regulator